jgi:hypothetical protein
MTSSATMVDSCHVHPSSSLAASDRVQGAGYSESEVETDDVTYIGDRCGSSRTGDRHGSSRIGDGGGHVSGNIEVGAVFE